MNYILSEKVMIIRLIAGQINKILLYKMSHCAEPDSRSRKQNKSQVGFV